MNSNNMNAISTITVLPSTKKEQETYIALVKDQILSGYTKPLEIARQLKSFEDVIKALRDDKEIKALFLDEAQKFGAKSFDDGAKFAIQSRKTYDFSECNDSEWIRLTNVINEAKTALKEREEFLKNIKEPIAMVGDGEVINPPSFTSNEILVITLNKE